MTTSDGSGDPVPDPQPPRGQTATGVNPINRYEILDTPPEAVFDEIVRLVAKRFGSAHAELSIVTPDRVWLKGALADQGSNHAPRDTFCAYVAADERPIVVTDASASPRFARHPRVTRPDGLRFYAGVPLIAPDGTVLGALCAWDEQPRSPDEDDLDALAYYGRHVIDLLELRRVSLQLNSSQALEDATRTLLELIVGGAELGKVLDTLARAIEASMESTRSSILLLDGVALHHGAAPSLPKAYRDAIDGVHIGPSVGCCGTAAYTREAVVVSDIATDSRWVDYRAVALAAGLRACWSVPIINRNGAVLGTFALYYDEIRSPTAEEFRQLSQWVNLAEVAISRAREVATLRDAATFDALTGLINRPEALRRLQAAASVPNAAFAVLFVDLDQFKFVNDTLGHLAGDRFLRAAAVRLAECAGPSATVARFGGDEFLVICPSIDSAEQAAAIGYRIVDALQQPLTIYGNAVALSASVGVALHGPSAGTASVDLVGDADLAMYAAKRSGRNSVTVFTTELRRKAATRLTVEAELATALSDGQMDCAYQPLVDLASGQLIGVEALLRWDSPSLGPVAPMTFIPAAEDSGQIVAIGEFVLEKACRQLASWQAADSHWNEIVIWVNIAPRQLRDSGFTQQVQKVLQRTGLPASNLGLEITESTLIEDLNTTYATLTGLRELGLHVAIDDFGTGYSSFAQLKHLPADALKIDWQFITDISADPVNSRIVEAIIALGSALGLRVTAEGIETQAQRDHLIALGCSSGQGYFWSPAVSAVALQDKVCAGAGVLAPAASGRPTGPSVVVAN